MDVHKLELSPKIKVPLCFMFLYSSHSRKIPYSQIASK
jgi:hypothetical protein